MHALYAALLCPQLCTYRHVSDLVVSVGGGADEE